MGAAQPLDRLRRLSVPTGQVGHRGTGRHRWSLLVLSEAALGTSRFSEFKARLGIATLS
jgi:hypothetical protein